MQRVRNEEQPSSDRDQARCLFGVSSVGLRMSAAAAGFLETSHRGGHAGLSLHDPLAVIACVFGINHPSLTRMKIKLRRRSADIAKRLPSAIEVQTTTGL